MELIGTLLVWALLGLAIGAVAKFLMPGPDGGGWLTTLLLGIAGAIVGGWIAAAIGLGSLTGFHPVGLVIAVLGAMLLLAVYRLVSRRTT
jgi:uncharacterized membrane protein YeaQ/YmgE (transglycosylase-associated protein family)